MLEDESGRLRLTGSFLSATHLATGAIIAVLGTENSNGDFEVIDLKVPDLPLQPPRWERDGGAPADTQGKDSTQKGGKIAFLSGLGITGTSSDTLALELLTDYLLGYTGFQDNEENSEYTNGSKITRLVIAGNSLGASVTVDAAANSEKKKAAPKKYGYDASAYNALPITQLDNFLAEILPSIPVTLMPGEQDPANFSLPQQGIHRAMFPQARAYCAPPVPADDKQEPGWFDSVTNPWEGDVEGWRLWGCSGQNVDDVLRYLDFADEDLAETDDSGARMRIMEAMLRWRCGVPTAPDTLCMLINLPPLPPKPLTNFFPGSYPFQEIDPFVLEACPHIFFAGSQPKFQTTMIEDLVPLRLDGGDTQMTDNENDSPTRVRLISLPRFSQTGELVLVDTETLEAEVIRFGVFTGQEEKK